MKGEIIIVREVMKRERKMADSVIFLKCMKSIPKPITVKRAVTMNKVLNSVTGEKLNGTVVFCTILY